MLAFQYCLWLMLLPSVSIGFSICFLTPRQPAASVSLQLSQSASLPSSSPENGRSWNLLPSLQELSSAPFMKQVQFGMELTTALRRTTTDDGRDGGEQHQNALKDAITSQLSHPDGIRGFMVAFLTSEYGDTAADDEGDKGDGHPAYVTIPPVVLQAVRGQLAPGEETYNRELVPLMCMNVVMPTGMITMHKDAEQSASSARTAKRGKQFLVELKDDVPEIGDNVKAILAVARGTKDEVTLQGCDGRLVEYWTDFFEKWGYEERQRADIARVMEEVSE